jgi:hypothetical protein
MCDAIRLFDRMGHYLRDDRRSPRHAVLHLT